MDQPVTFRKRQNISMDKNCKWGTSSVRAKKFNVYELNFISSLSALILCLA